MTALNSHLIVKTMPLANENNVIKGKGFRITVLTPCLIRVEVQKDNLFTDEATQYIWHRDFPKVKYKVETQGKVLLITTEKVIFNFDGKKVNYVYLDEKWVACNNRKNLGGTCRTLDMRAGKVGLEDGVLSKNGVSVLVDDGLILVDGALKARKAKEKDEYVFAYGNNYRQALNDYFILTQENPFLPRYVLGNWWSRYHAYTQQEYIDLMSRFEKEDLPFTIATVDMDWHWVKVNEKFGKKYPTGNPLQGAGWTGYSWNTDLFPDHRAFLKWLHDHNYHTTLNLHPAQGVREFEDMYEEMAKAVGIDPKSGETVKFDLADNNFINAYFDILHHPYEEDGVDFWWIDWQQGKKSTLKDLDPLWALNHYHYLDNCRGGKRGLILSRYCGIGSHRYPLGFSGDYRVRWKSLNYQPEFTNTASNIGYDWWSHDIGGHNFGYYDDEMYLRWCQYGVFSPINRLHSTNFDLQGKEPWKHSETVRRITGDYLRLRHALIPYIYTACYRTHTENRALCEPMYYHYPNVKEAYKVPNQYYFGSELIVCPVTKKVNKKVNLAQVKVWLPKGRYTDIFTNYVYEGGRMVTMSRDLEHIPVLAKEGAIIPLSSDKGNKCDNPTNMKVLVYRGNNSYTLYEDDGLTNGYKYGKFATTTMTVSEKDNVVKFVINPVEGDESVVPTCRKYTICLKDIVGGKLYVNGEEKEFSEEITVHVNAMDGLEIMVADVKVKDNGDAIENVKVIFSRAQGGNFSKMIRFLPLQKITDKDQLRKKIKTALFAKCVKVAALEKLL